MELSPLLSPQGVPVFVAGGSKSFKTFEYKGLAVSFEWVASERRGKSFRCLCIWRMANVFVKPGDGSATRGIWTISERDIANMLQAGPDGIKLTGGPSAYGRREALAALEVLGFDKNDRHALHAVLDVISQFATDLPRMPAVPRWMKEQVRKPPMWEVRAFNKESGKTISEREV